MKWGDIMVTVCQPLIEILSKIPDFRKEKGKRHPLSAILALATSSSMRCHDAKGYSAIAEWGRNYDKEFAKALGFTHEKTPCSATFWVVYWNHKSITRGSKSKAFVRLSEKSLAHREQGSLGAGCNV